MKLHFYRFKNLAKRQTRDQIFQYHFIMLFHFLRIFFLICHAIASRSDKEIYNEARDTILSISKVSYQRLAPKSWQTSLKELNKFGSDLLVKLMNEDTSDEFLILYFFGYSSECPLMIFRNINLLCTRKGSPQFGIHLIKIFENFRSFLFWKFVYAKEGCCSDFKKLSPSIPSDLPLDKNFWERAKPPVEVSYDDFLSSRGFPANFKLLKNLEFLWKNRLERLAKRLLTVDEFDKISNQIKDTFDFLNSFLKYGLDFMLIKEYKGLYDDIQAVGIENSSTFKNFLFLFRHFRYHLKDPDSIIDGLGMLASKSPEFIILICFIYEKGTDNIDSQNFKHLISRDFIQMHKYLKYYIHPIREGFEVFQNIVTEPEGIYFANKILQKTNEFISEELVKNHPSWRILMGSEDH
jgi:hypothetical protein